MSRRDQIRMSDDEIRKFLDEQQTMIIVSNGPGGFPHPMPMWFGTDPEGTIRMATYSASQKILNVQRDPRVTLLAETGTRYEELRGVVIYGHADLIVDLELAIDTLIDAAGATGMPADAKTNPEVRKAMVDRAKKRTVIRVKPERIVSWDHSKLGGTY